MSGEEVDRKPPAAQDKYMARADARPTNAPGSHFNYEDLKVPLRKTRALGNSAQSWRGNQRANQRAQVISTTQSLLAAQKIGQQSDGRRESYDSDLSNTGDTLMMSVKQARIAAAAPIQQDQPPSSSEASEGSDEQNGTDNEDEEMTGQEPSKAQLYGLSRKQEFLVSKLGSDLRKLPDGFSLPYIDGDSYPETTSGRLSEADEVHNEEETTHNHGKYLLPHNTGQERHPSGNLHSVKPRTLERAQDGRSVREQLQDRDTNKRDVPVRSHGNRDGMNEPGATTSGPFAKRSRLERPSQAMRQKQVVEPSQAKPPIFTNITQQALQPSAHELPQQRPLKQEEYLPNAGGEAPAPWYPNGPTERDSKRDTVHIQNDRAEHVPETEQLSDVGPDTNRDVASGLDPRAHRQQTGINLDYQPPELFKMRYQELKGQSFDVAPHACELNLPSELQNAQLESKLSAVSGFRPSDQGTFFSSLSIDEWEQAGAWFLGRFGEIYGKLKDARQEKRKAAKLFEEEIERRYGAVSKKRKQIEDSLTDMKENGGKVLQATPKKSRMNGGG